MNENVYGKLNRVQSELVAPKNQTNAFGKYKYRSCEDILEGVKKLLGREKAVIVISDDIVAVSDRIYVKAIAKFIDVETGECIENSAFAREPLSKKGMDEAQITGSTSSYARKYALNGLLLVDDTKDADSMDNSSSGAPKQQTPDKPWLNDINELIDVARKNNWTADEAVKQAKVNYAVSNKTAGDIKIALS
jgi:hypothetical protein